MIETDRSGADRAVSRSGRRWRIYPPYLRKLIAEAVLIWAVLRFLLTLMADEPLLAMVSVLLLAACILLVRLDLHLMRERMFFRNLGVPPALLVGLALLPAALLDLAVRWIPRAYLT